jgi:F0F1-type ATP synthase assembly protein I
MARQSMPDDDRSRHLERSLEEFQESVRKSGPAAGGSYALIGAILLFGAIGYGIDVWQKTTPWCALGGLLLGLVVGFWELAKTVFKR